VLYSGTTAAIAALTDVSEGCIAFDTTLNVLKAYTDDAWTPIDFDHTELKGLNIVDPEAEPITYYDHHPQYLKLDKESQVLLQDLLVAEGVTIDGRDISSDKKVIDLVTPISTFGDWDGTYVAGTVYGPEDYDSLVRVYGSGGVSDDEYEIYSGLYGYIGTTSSPATLVGFAEDDNVTIIFIVPAGYYWKVSEIVGLEYGALTIKKMRLI
jgi:hypothetical protein